MTITEKRRGSITLETSIVLTIFVFMMLFFLGLFQVVVARNIISHTLIQSTKSLSMDSYLMENVEFPRETTSNFWGGLGDVVMNIFCVARYDEYYTELTDWYNADTANPDIAKKRFIGYFADGNLTDATALADKLGIVDGLNGIQFEMQVADEDITVTLEYTIQIWFDFWNLGKIPVKQSITSRLWM